jgi:ABC-2 type transport system permease protein
LNEMFDVGAFSEEPGKKDYTRASVLAFERRTLQTGKHQIRLQVDQLPHFVGVDPFNERIDRNGDDNLTEVPAP